MGSHFFDPDGVTDAGESFMYQVESNGSVSLLNRFTAPDKKPNDQFGKSIHLSSEILVVGAAYANGYDNISSGAAYAFDIGDFTSPNTGPITLHYAAPLLIAENRPVGTLVGEFNATDPDGDILTYALVNGVGATDNAWFTLETNGTLRTATVFDYETNASTYSIRVRASDEYNASVEGNFTITLTNELEAPPGLELLGDSLMTHSVGEPFTDPGALWTEESGASGVVFANEDFDGSIPGIFILTYSHTDSDGREAESVSREVIVLDLSPPVVTLIGPSTILHEAGDEYVDEGAVWTDNVEGDGEVSADTQVDWSKPGIYVLRYERSDGSGNRSETVTRTVIVRDTRLPVITILGDGNMVMEAGDEYLDLGASWFDLVDGNGTLTGVGEVLGLVPGEYEVRYEFTDSSGNEAQPKTRIVRVLDRSAPHLELNGLAESIHPVGESYVDPGANWFDLVDGNGTVFAEGPADWNVLGERVLIYRKSDQSGNAAEPVSRKVLVADLESPRFGTGRGGAGELASGATL